MGGAGRGLWLPSILSCKNRLTSFFPFDWTIINSNIPVPSLNMHIICRIFYHNTIQGLFLLFTIWTYRFMSEILPIRRKTPNKQSISQSICNIVVWFFQKQEADKSSGKPGPAVMGTFKLFCSPHYASWLFVAFFMGVSNGLIWGFLYWHLENLGYTIDTLQLLVLK